MDFISVFPNPFFISREAPMTTGIDLVFIPHILLIPIFRSLYFDSFSVTLTVVSFEWYGHIYDGTFLCCLVFDDNIWPIGFDLSAELHWHGYLGMVVSSCSVTVSG